ncbi:MAG: TldD/PmbA family protein, partial [Proteobacteria bacterium]|nr:TldD/PmbA family protein [Pseudomonadota bacterium]
MAAARGLSADELRAISERILQLSQADHCRVNINSGWRGYTRVATNRITSAGGSESTTVNITSVFGQRVASVNTNRLEDDDLLQALRQSEDMARLAPENLEYMP